MTDLAYSSYWARKQLIAAGFPPFELIGCSGRGLDGQALRVVANAIAGKGRLLDVGAGDLTIRDTLRAEGFTGEYETLDIGGEYDYTYTSIEQPPGKFGAVLLLDVIEHISLEAGLELLRRAFSMLDDGGVLVVQTPNARCVRSPFTSDMTHVQSYNVVDLWAYLTVLGSTCVGYRVQFVGDRGVLARAGSLLAKLLITRVIGLDYADNILLVAAKPAK